MDDTDNLAEALEPEDVPVEDEQEDEAAVELDEDGNPIEEPDEAEEDSEDDNLEDVEIDGKTYKVPKDAALRQADYTRKTQALADRAKEVDAVLERLTSTSQEQTQALAKVAFVEAKLSEFENVDWNTWDQTNPIQANNARWQLSELQRQRDGAIAEYTQAQQVAQLVAQQETAKRLEQGYKVLAEKIPGWNADKASAILDFGVKAYGFDPEELRAIDNPLAILVLHDAMEGRKVTKQAATKAKIEKQQAVKPAATVKGGTAAVKGLDDRLSTSEWMKRREQQLRRQQGR